LRQTFGTFSHFSSLSLPGSIRFELKLIFALFCCRCSSPYHLLTFFFLLASPDDSQATVVFVALAIILFIVMVAMISVICIKSGKKKLPPADIISEVSTTR
jgi:heme/copper-type cytochrome/quinol oxidase subunit 4